MIYTDFKECKLSMLGMGCMRLPCKDEKKIDIDIEETRKMVDLAIKSGINYFDTAVPYHGGNCEKVIGNILQSYPRNSFYYASKFPGHSAVSFENYKTIFKKQLEDSGLQYFDFYLFHNVCEADLNAYIRNADTLLPFLKKQKEKGIIHHIGFSMHGNTTIILKFLETYGEIIEFCQIQLNWFDWNFINAKENVKLLNERNIPIWVMEPMRGGRLTGLPDETKTKLEALLPNASASDIAFRYLQTVPGVTVILTGASSLKQMEENISIFAEKNPLSENECEELYRIQKEMPCGVPCTECRYCIDSCPKELDIPRILKIYNDSQFTGNEFIILLAVAGIKKSKRPMECLHCKKCQKKCPQGIKISKIMKKFSKDIIHSKEPRNPFADTKKNKK